nr:MAG TPA: hypothetical protein [Bacteriophage sp.]
MAYTVSQNFKNAVKDVTAPKSCLILFGDLFFSTSDFTDAGVYFEQYFNTSDDLTFGDCPSDIISFSVVANGNLSGYGFGKAQAYLGIQIASEPYVFGDINAHIEVGGNTYTASSSGLYRNNTKISSAVYVSLVSDGTYVYAIGANYSSKTYNATGDIVAYTPNRFMAQKLQTPLSAVFSANLAYVWDGTNVLTYEYVPMGVYNIDKPRNTVGDVVVVQDAYDNMTLFDRDADQFVKSLSYPITLSEIYTNLCNFVGVSYASSTFPYSTTSYSASPFPDSGFSLRDILWWIAERARRVAHFNRIGELTLMTINTTARETLTASDIGQDGYSVAEFLTPAVSGVLLRGSSGTSLTFGALDTPYVISANPFISTISTSDLQAYWAIPRYVPMELKVLEADPSIDVGDFVNIKPMVDEIQLLTNVYGEVYASLTALTAPGTDDALASNGTMLARVEAMAAEGPTYTIPIMGRTVRFIGGIRADYVATGNENREADISNTEYNADVAGNKAKDYTKKLDESLTQKNVFDRLTNNGQAQGIFLSQNGDLYINGTYIQAKTIAVSKLTGTITNSDWGIDFDNGTMTIGTLAVNKITGSLSTTSTSSSNWGINFSTGTINIGTLAVGKITGNITGSNNWKIDFTNGSMTIGTLAVGSITGSLSTTSTSSNNWGIDFSTGTINIGTLAVGKITGTLSTTSTTTNNWGIDFTNGTMNIGTLAVGKITGSKTLDNNWGIDFTNGTMSIGNLSADNITAGTITAAVTATNLTMSGGSISITTSDSSYDYIVLNQTIGGVTYSFRAGSMGSQVSALQSGVGYGTRMDSNQLVVYQNTSNSSFTRASLSYSGMSFYDSSATLRLQIQPPSSDSVTIQPTVVSTW